jgi:hypothetical protein
MGIHETLNVDYTDSDQERESRDLNQITNQALITHLENNLNQNESPFDGKIPNILHPSGFSKDFISDPSILVA